MLITLETTGHYSRNKISEALIVHACKPFVFNAYLPTLPVFLGVSKFFIKSPGKYLTWLISIFFHQFRYFQESKKENKTKWIYCSYLSCSQSENFEKWETERSN